MKILKAGGEGYWEKVLPKLLVLASAGVVIGITAVWMAYRNTKNDHTHIHFVNAEGGFIHSDVLLDNRHACDGRFIEVTCQVPSKERIEEVFKRPEALAAITSSGATDGSPG